jgi:hypothetical protein
MAICQKNIFETLAYIHPTPEYFASPFTLPGSFILQSVMQAAETWCIITSEEYSQS